MKIKCRKIISATTKEDLGNSSPWLTLEKEYVVLAIELSPKDGINVLIQTDHHNDPIFFSLDGFEIIDQKIPTNWSVKVEKNQAYYLMPTSWMYIGFFEDLDDQADEAMMLFKNESEQIYHEAGLI